jgi:hypothetical protein
MSRLITRLCQEIISLKQRPGTKLLIQKLQQKIDELERQANDTQKTNKTS